MSNYRADAFNPKKGKIEDASWLDNHFGQHVYGVKFDGDEIVYRAVDCGLLAAAAELTRLQQSNAALMEREGNAVRLLQAIAAAYDTPTSSWMERVASLMPETRSFLNAAKSGQRT